MARPRSSAMTAAIAAASVDVGDDGVRDAGAAPAHRVQLGAGRQRVGQPRVVGAGVDGDHRPAGARPGPATVAAPIPRAAPVTIATEAIRAPYASSAPCSAASSARPCCGAGPRRVAEHAVGAGGAHAVGRAASASARPTGAALPASRAVAIAPARARSPASARSPAGRRGRRLTSAGVQARTSRPSARSRATASGSGWALPPCAHTNSTRGERLGRRAAELDQHRAGDVAPDRQRARRTPDARREAP